MTPKNKKLLLTDLCARLPYGVIVEDRNGIHELTTWNAEFTDLLYNSKCDIKPYLFPLSSMTEEQKNDCPINETTLNIINSNIGCYGIIEIPWRLSFLFIDWCNKNHFDYRGLIPMDLANDATGLNIY